LFSTESPIRRSQHQLIGRKLKGVSWIGGSTGKPYAHETPPGTSDRSAVLNDYNVYAGLAEANLPLATDNTAGPRPAS
jgi:hypothetical protein